MVLGAGLEPTGYTTDVYIVQDFRNISQVSILYSFDSFDPCIIVYHRAS